ncbi:hypothetical protein [Ferruginibacter sp.]
MKDGVAIPGLFESKKMNKKFTDIKNPDIKKWWRIKYIKWSSWEYWPMWVVYLPASMYFIYLCIRAKSFCFFSAANPSIENGGMIFESKWEIFKLIPQQYYPVTIIIREQENINTLISKMYDAGLKFPVVAKPDRGERGWCVEILKNITAAQNYLSKYPVDVLLQEYVDYPIELSVFYYRHPDAPSGIVSSVTRKEYLKVTGDGISTLYELIQKNSRAFLQLEQLEKLKTIDLSKILPEGKIEILVPFGNHVRGAMFLDYCNIIDNKLNTVFNTVSKQIDGFYFGRFDIKCNSIEDLKAGKYFSILELNGSGAEPAHIYQPGFSYFKAQSVITQHYQMMYDAAKANRKKGVPYMSLKAFRATNAAQKKHRLKVKI